MKSINTKIMKWIFVTFLLSFSIAFAQIEPTLNQVYALAYDGKPDKAEMMIQQILLLNPKSGKAYFVQSELYASHGDLVRSRDALASAERLEPGLKFARAESVQGLRAQLAPKNYTSSNLSSSSWTLLVFIIIGVMGLGYFMFRRRQ